MDYINLLLKFFILAGITFGELFCVFDFKHRTLISATSDLQIKAKENDIYCEIIPKSNSQFFLYKSAARRYVFETIPLNDKNQFIANKVGFDFVFLRIFNSQTGNRTYKIERGSNGLEFNQTDNDFSWIFYYTILFLKFFLGFMFAALCIAIFNRFVLLYSHFLAFVDLLYSLFVPLLTFIIWIYSI